MYVKIKYYQNKEVIGSIIVNKSKHLSMSYI